MAVGDWSTTASNNTAISGINIAENCSPANINNAIRQLMVDIRTFYDIAIATGSWQPLDATLTALAGVTTAADKLIYATGSDAFTTTTITAAARTLLDDATTADMLTTLGAMTAPSVSGSASSGKITIGTFTITWRDHTFTANTSTTYAYGASHTYSSWARAWCTGGSADNNAQDNNAFVSSSGVSSATVHSARDVDVSGTLFSIGV